MKCLCQKIYYSPPVPVSPGGVIEVGAGEDITYQDVIDVTCTEKHHGKRTGPAIITKYFLFILDDKFAGWVLQTTIDDTVNVSKKYQYTLADSRALDSRPTSG